MNQALIASTRAEFEALAQRWRNLYHVFVRYNDHALGEPKSRERTIGFARRTRTEAYVEAIPCGKFERPARPGWAQLTDCFSASVFLLASQEPIDEERYKQAADAVQDLKRLAEPLELLSELRSYAEPNEGRAWHQWHDTNTGESMEWHAPSVQNDPGIKWLEHVHVTQQSHGERVHCRDGAKDSEGAEITYIYRPVSLPINIFKASALSLDSIGKPAETQPESEADNGGRAKSSRLFPETKPDDPELVAFVQKLDFMRDGTTDDIVFARRILTDMGLKESDAGRWMARVRKLRQSHGVKI